MSYRTYYKLGCDWSVTVDVIQHKKKEKKEKKSGKIVFLTILTMKMNFTSWLNFKAIQTCQYHRSHLDNYIKLDAWLITIYCCSNLASCLQICKDGWYSLSIFVTIQQKIKENSISL